MVKNRDQVFISVASSCHAIIKASGGSTLTSIFFDGALLLPVVETLRILDPTTVNYDKLKLNGAPMKSGGLSLTSVTRT